MRRQNCFQSEMTEEAGEQKIYGQPVRGGAVRLQRLSLSLFSLYLSLLHAQTGAVVLSQRTYSSWPASLGVHRHKAD